MSKLMKGQHGLRIIVANGEMLVYNDWSGQLSFSRPIYEDEWDELIQLLVSPRNGKPIWYGGEEE
tara:strand:- start:440 stop:634 length:195 start_codon:yes stop_codon:yes gene_type:complete